MFQKHLVNLEMNIVHFSWEFPPVLWGGLGTFVSEITKKQVQLGHTVTVFGLNKDNQLKNEELWNGVKVFRTNTIEMNSVFKILVNNDVLSWGERFQYFSDVLNYGIASAYRCVQEVRKKSLSSIDVLEGHDWLSILGTFAVKEDLSIPLIFHLHSTEQGRSLGDGSDTIKRIEFEGGQKADGIITVSNAMKEELVRLGFPEHKIRVCWNAVDADKYNMNRFSSDQIHDLRAKYGIADDETMLFFIGRLVTVKGPDKLLRAVPSIFKEFPNCKLVILGKGDMEQYLRNLVSHFHIADNVRIVPEFVDEERRILHYAASDVVVLPSLYEPFGIVCTEAMSMGKPVVVGAAGTNGMREQVIPEGKNICGYHVDPKRPDDIAWGIRQILTRGDKGKQLGMNGRKRVLEEFTWDKITQKTLAIYEDFVY